MSKLSELIQQYCPDGVEYRHLNTCCKINKGEQLNKELLSKEKSNKYPHKVINGGRNPSGYWNTSNKFANTITISQGGAAGFVDFQIEDFWAGAHCYVLEDSTKDINYKFLYYNLKFYEKTLTECQYGAVIPALAKKDVEFLEIPVPPMPVQEEIVRILDKFTELETELETELSMRKKQYEYYRDKLMAFSENVKLYYITDIFDLKNGYTPSKSNNNYWTNGTVDWFRMEDIRANGHILISAIQKVSRSAVKGGKLFKANSIMLATSATIGEHALIKVDCLGNQRFTFFSAKDTFEKYVNMNYMNYYFYKIDEWCKSHLYQGNFASVDMDALKKLQVPVPDMTEQERIVDILDKFSKLTTDISEGLPAEIKMRHQQYEYYRDKLLSFKRLEKND